MKLCDVLNTLEQIAPARHAAQWDNVGLIAGDPAQEVSRAMLTIDYTPEVACEAAGERCDLIVAYHPPIFDPIKRLTAGHVVFDAIRRGVAIYSPHTALDLVDGGTNDVLADAIGLTTRKPLRPSEGHAGNYKLVTFVPENGVERVSRALFDAGAGRIGNYRDCSFRSNGTGTFFGDPGTMPSVGAAGRHEKTPEIRLEMILPIGRASEVIQALRSAHPYEEPAFDLQQLAAVPSGLGMGRVGDFSESVERSILIDRVKRALLLSHLLIAGPSEGTATRAAVCAGACGDLLDDAIASRADIYLTGEMRHHDALKAARAGLTVLCTLHSNSERATLVRLKAQLAAAIPDLPVVLSQMDRDPFSIR